MAHRRYNVTLLNSSGTEIRIRPKLKPLLILDLASEQGLREATRRLDALLADLSRLDPSYGHESTTYRLAIYDEETAALIGHWTDA